jgi:threonine/homoserine/homoserine lactone efflux protein
MMHFITIGIILGLSAGFSPGPLLALVIAETLRHGAGAGVRVALAPLVTDLPIVAFSFLVLAKLSRSSLILGVVSLCGSAVVFYMGLNSLRARGDALTPNTEPSKSLTKGILVNFLSPHPYLFWLSVGAPLMTRALRESGVSASVAFIVSFYVCLVGSKSLLAVVTGRSRSFLQGNGYIYIVRFLGLVLCALALLLLQDGLRLLGLWSGSWI